MNDFTDTWIVARTKHQAPMPRPDLVERPALEGRLAAALASCRLTLVVAPAGWGKTSALTRQLAALPDEVESAWLTADVDDDLPRFAAALGAALAPLALAWRVAPSALPMLAAGEHGGRGVRALVDEVVNAMASLEAARGVLVLDDMHRIDDETVVGFVAALVERLPANWSLVLASRHDLAGLPVARWRARGELAELRQSELRFDEREVAALLRRRGADPAQAAEWRARTEGWIAGLQLLLTAGGAHGRASLTSGQRHVFDFLAEEVLDQMPAPLRLFLLRSSVLPELSAARCAHVAGVSPAEARALLERIERGGLFVTQLDSDGGDGTSLRLHDLFRDFLVERLEREFADQLPALLVRAAEHEGDVARAVGWLLRAGDADRAARHLLAHGATLLGAGAHASIERLVQSMPPAALAAHPELHLLHALAAYAYFRFEDVIERCERAIAGLAAIGRGSEAVLARIYCAVARMNDNQLDRGTEEIDALRAEGHPGLAGALIDYFSAWTCYAHADPAGVGPLFESAVRKFEALGDATAWEHLYFHAMFHGLPGTEAALARTAAILEQLTGHRPSMLRVALHHSRAALALGQARPGEAAHWLARADADLRWVGGPQALVTENGLLHAVIDAVHGDAAACEARREQLVDQLNPHSAADRLCHRQSGLVAMARAWWALGRHDDVAHEAALMRAGRNPYEWKLADDEQALLDAMVALARGDAPGAEALLRARGSLGPLDNAVFFRGTSQHLVCVLAQLRQGRLDDAARTLGPWLAHVRAGGLEGGALMLGPGPLGEIANAPWGERLDATDRTRLARLHAISLEARSPATAPPAAGEGGDFDPLPPAPAGNALRRALAAGLTAREAEVLERMAAGDANKVIARRLELSPHTVKRHVANVLGKLALQSRVQAASWWHGRLPED